MPLLGVYGAQHIQSRHWRGKFNSCAAACSRRQQHHKSASGNSQHKSIERVAAEPFIMHHRRHQGAYKLVLCTHLAEGERAALFTLDAGSEVSSSRCSPHHASVGHQPRRGGGPTARTRRNTDTRHQPWGGDDDQGAHQVLAADDVTVWVLSSWLALSQWVICMQDSIVDTRGIPHGDILFVG